LTEKTKGSANSSLTPKKATPTATSIDEQRGHFDWSATWAQSNMQL